MSHKTVLSGAWMLTLVAVCAVRAGDPAPTESLPPPAGLETQQVQMATPTPLPSVLDPAPGLSQYITYHQPDCCGPIGGCGPIGMELYARTGATVPVFGDKLGHRLEPGVMVEGGGRSLFYDASDLAAWAIDLSLSYQYNNGNDHSSIPFSPLPVTVRALHRTYVNLAVGREWYLLHNAHCGKCNWRVGTDIGGGWGAGRLDLNDPFQSPSGFTRLYDTIGRVFAAAYTDVEIPCGCCTWILGARGEWSYDFMNFRRITPGCNVSDANILLVTGVRF